MLYLPIDAFETTRLKQSRSHFHLNPIMASTSPLADGAEDSHRPLNRAAKDPLPDLAGKPQSTNSLSKEDIAQLCLGILDEPLGGLRPGQTSVLLQNHGILDAEGKSSFMFQTWHAHQTAGSEFKLPTVMLQELTARDHGGSDPDRVWVWRMKRNMVLKGYLRIAEKKVGWGEEPGPAFAQTQVWVKSGFDSVSKRSDGKEMESANGLQLPRTGHEGILVPMEYVAAQLDNDHGKQTTTLENHLVGRKQDLEKKQVEQWKQDIHVRGSWENSAQAPVQATETQAGHQSIRPPTQHDNDSKDAHEPKILSSAPSSNQTSISQPILACPVQSNIYHSPQDHQYQLMRLEQQNRRRVEQRKQNLCWPGWWDDSAQAPPPRTAEMQVDYQSIHPPTPQEDNAESAHEPKNFSFEPPSVRTSSSQPAPSQSNNHDSLQDYQYKLLMLEQENRRRLQEARRDEQEAQELRESYLAATLLNPTSSVQPDHSGRHDPACCSGHNDAARVPASQHRSLASYEVAREIREFLFASPGALVRSVTDGASGEVLLEFQRGSDPCVKVVRLVDKMEEFMARNAGREQEASWFRRTSPCGDPDQAASRADGLRTGGEGEDGSEDETLRGDEDDDGVVLVEKEPVLERRKKPVQVGKSGCGLGGLFRSLSQRR